MVLPFFVATLVNVSAIEEPLASANAANVHQETQGFPPGLELVQPGSETIPKFDGAYKPRPVKLYAPMQAQTVPEILVEPDKPDIEPELAPVIPESPQLSPNVDQEVVPHKIPEGSVQPQIPDATPSESLKKEPTEELRRAVLKEIIINALDNSVERYPWLINQSDQLILNPNTFQATESNLQVNFGGKFSSSAIVGEDELDNPFLDRLSFSHSIEDRQFYWISENNSVVVETQGTHGTFMSQGQSTSDNGKAIQQETSQTEGLFGVQAVWALPSIISNLKGKENADKYSTTTIAIEISDAPDVPINEIIFDTGVDLDDPQVILLDNLDFGETYSPEGGGVLFENLEADNTPLILQGFPTTNLQPLIANGGELRVGQVVAPEDYAQIRQGLDNSDFSSLAGVHVLRPNQGANEDLVRVLANPYLSQQEQDFHYLNSFLWVSLGQRDPEVSTINVDSLPGEDVAEGKRLEENEWKRFTMSHSRHRALLEYHPEDIELNYASIFANPGLSLSVSDFTSVDINQTAHATLGMLVGSLFYITPNNVADELNVAREKYKNLQPLGSLKTAATSQQRRAMNTRLNKTLKYADNSGSLHQASGSWTFASKTTPEDSRLFQIRSGLYKRGILFISTDTKVNEIGSPSIEISDLRISNNDFGPLTFRGERFPTHNTSLDETEQRIAAQTIIRTPDGPVFVSTGFSHELQSTTTVPLIDPLRPFDIAFDLIELTQTSKHNIRVSSDIYSGHLYLPAMELLVAGTKGDLSYGFAVGGWLNLAPDQAPGLQGNQGEELELENFTKEPSLGVYLKATSDWVFQDLDFDENSRLTALTTHKPFVSLNWNSAANRLNLVSAFTGYQFFRRQRNFSFSLTPAVIYSLQNLNAVVPETSQGQFTANLSVSFATQEGLNIRSNLEIGDSLFFDTEATNRIFSNKEVGTLALGAYYSNSNTIDRGISSRVSDSRLGIVIDYIPPTPGTSVNLKLGNSDTGFEALLEGRVKMSL
ncbi:MAG: hypothetical protein AAGF83_26805 [Cyanobacteria bacterium P01_G01_bin.67]